MAFLSGLGEGCEEEGLAPGKLKRLQECGWDGVMGWS